MSARLVTCISVAVAVMALATVAFGWVGVPLVAAVIGLAAPWLRLRTVWIGVAAVIAWGALLAGQTVSAAAGTVAGVLGGVFGVPGIVPIVMTLTLAFALAWSAGTVGALGTQVTQAIRGARTEKP